MPCCCTHTRGGNRTQGAKHMVSLCHPYSHDPTFRRGTSELGRWHIEPSNQQMGNNGKNAKGTAVRPYSHAHLSVGRPSSGRRTSDQAKWHRCATRTPTLPPFGGTSGRATSSKVATKHTPVLPRPPFGGTSELRAACAWTEQTAPAVHARTPTPPPFGGGRPSYKATCTTGQQQPHRSDSRVG